MGKGKRLGRSPDRLGRSRRGDWSSSEGSARSVELDANLGEKMNKDRVRAPGESPSVKRVPRGSFGGGRRRS
jgi:hypothetical protein